MIKAYTDIRQSCKLAEFLPLDSADMYFDGYGRLPQGYAYTLISPNSFEHDYPCWSLAALLPFLSGCVFHTPNPLGKSYCCKHITSEFEVHSDNLVDTCYQMLSKLHEQKLI